MSHSPPGRVAPSHPHSFLEHGSVRLDAETHRAHPETPPDPCMEDRTQTGFLVSKTVQHALHRLLKLMRVCGHFLRASAGARRPTCSLGRRHTGATFNAQMCC